MATMKNFEDLIAWQKARELAGYVYSLTRQDNFSRDYQCFTKCRSERSEESLLLSWSLPVKVEMLHFVQHDNLFVIY